MNINELGKVKIVKNEDIYKFEVKQQKNYFKIIATNAGIIFLLCFILHEQKIIDFTFVVNLYRELNR